MNNGVEYGRKHPDIPMERLIMPINTIQGCAHTIKAGYFKSGTTNFLRKVILGKQDGFIATGVIEILTDEEGRSDV